MHTIGSVILILAFATTALAGSLPTWDKKIAGTKRFKLLPAFANEVVIDRETGLLWELAPSAGFNWRNAHRHCSYSNTGGRMGWRLPALDELLTLVDPDRSPAIAEGAPFTGMLTELWTANDDAADPATLAVSVDLNAFLLRTRSQTLARSVLCVRGGRGSTASGRAGD